MKMKKTFSMLFVAVLLLSTTPMSTFAYTIEERTSEQHYERTLEGAKAYLKNFCIKGVNEFGDEFTTAYQFDVDHDLNKAAAYIVKYGYEQFHIAVDDQVSNVLSGELASNVNRPQTTTPNYVTATNAGSTANYVITKTIEIFIGDFGFEIKSETDPEVFAILTALV